MICTHSHRGLHVYTYTLYLLYSSTWYMLKSAIILAEEANILVQLRDVTIPGPSISIVPLDLYVFHPTFCSAYFFNLRCIKFDSKLTSLHKPLHIATVFKIRMIHPVLMVMRNNVQYHRAQIYPEAFVRRMLLDALNLNARL